jgi:hypothetical protein
MSKPVPKWIEALAVATTLLCAQILLPQVVTAEKTPQTNPAPSEASEDSAFLPVDTNSLQTISGKSLATKAYGIILTIFLLYILSIVKREHAVKRATKDLGDRIKNSP